MTRHLFGRLAVPSTPQKDPEPEPRHDYSNLQVAIVGRAADIMAKLAREVPDKDLTLDGRENDRHITCRWGLHFMSPSARLKAALRDFGPVTVVLGRTSLFRNPDADVLKVEVQSEDLHRLYKLIGRVVPVHTTHPVYKPHATIAYLKPGKGDKYAGNKALDGMKLTFDSVVFSGKNGKRVALPLGAPVGGFRVR